MFKPNDTMLFMKDIYGNYCVYYMDMRIVEHIRVGLSIKDKVKILGFSDIVRVNTTDIMKEECDLGINYMMLKGNLKKNKWFDLNNCKCIGCCILGMCDNSYIYGIGSIKQKELRYYQSAKLRKEVLAINQKIADLL